MAIGRDFRVGLFDRLSGPGGTGFDYTEDDKNRISRQGLLGLAAGLLGTGGGFGNALSNGLKTGLLSFNQGADDLVNDRYRQAMMQRTMAGMDRNNQVQELAGRAFKDGQLDQSVYPQLAALDPEYAKNLRSAIEGQRKPLRLTEMTDPRNPANVISVLTDDEGTILYPDKTPVDFGGGGSQAAPPGGPLSGVLPGPSASDIGIFKPEQVQSQFTQLASIFPGTQISSRLRTPEHNRAVGGVANSQHIRGTAADFVVPAQARPDFIQRAKGMGFQAIDEGDHVHLELPGRGGARPQVAQQGNRFSRPRYAPTSAQARGPSDLERRMGLAKQMGASDEEIKRLVLGQSAPSKNDAIGGKALTAGTVEKMTKNAERMRNLSDLQSSFKDSYAGNLLGNFENLGGRLGNIQSYAMLPAATPGQTEWWQQYDREKNVIRNELFGAALTASEAAAFDQADINPRMDPKIIKANLKKQRDIIERGLQRQGKVWAAQGYNRAAIDAAIGSDAADADMPGIDDIVSKYGVR